MKKVSGHLSDDAVARYSQAKTAVSRVREKINLHLAELTRSMPKRGKPT